MSSLVESIPALLSLGISVAFGRDFGSLPTFLEAVGNFVCPGSFGTFGGFGILTGNFGPVGTFGTGAFGTGTFGTGTFGTVTFGTGTFGTVGGRTGGTLGGTFGTVGTFTLLPIDMILMMQPIH